MDTTVEAVLSIVLAVVALTGIALVVSKNSNTTNVISTGVGGLANMITVAISPVSGSAPGAYNTSSGLPY